MNEKQHKADIANRLNKICSEIQDIETDIIRLRRELENKVKDVIATYIHDDSISWDYEKREWAENKRRGNNGK